MSLQGWREKPVRSAWVTNDPSDSSRRRRPSNIKSMSRRPSGRKPMPVRPFGTRATTSLLPSRSTVTTSRAPMSENHRRSSCQRGDSPITRPVSRVRTSAIEDSSRHAMGELLARRWIERHMCVRACSSWCLIGIGENLTTPPLPHHRTYGSRIRRFGSVNKVFGSSTPTPLSSPVGHEEP
jgi:hypothetical protein